MKFLLLRNITTPGSPVTLGELFLNGKHFAYTLEDEIAETKATIEKIKSNL